MVVVKRWWQRGQGPQVVKKCDANLWHQDGISCSTAPDARFAAFVTIGEEDDRIKIVALPAAKIKGRLVDSNGKPRTGLRLAGWLTIGPNEALEGRGRAETQTDKDGRFTLGGLVVGARCLFRVWDGAVLKDFQVEEAKTIDLGDIMFDGR